MSNRVDLLIATGLTGLLLTGGIVLAMPEPQPSGWGGAGSVQSISISLGAGQAETGEAEVDAQSAASVDSVVAEQPEDEPEETTEPEPEPLEELDPVEEVEPVPEPQPEPEPEPELVKEQPEPEPVPEPVPEPEVVEVEPEPEPKPEPEPVVVQQLAEVLTVRTKPKPPVAKPVAPAPTKVAEPVKQAPKPTTQPAGQSNSVKSEGATGENTQSQAASSSSGSGGGAANKAAMVDYETSVLQMLSRFREYPERAIRRKIEGVNRIRLVIDRDGTVLEATMVTSSGASILDRETQRMIERVKKFPPFPDAMTEDRVEWIVPVTYKLN